MSCFHGCSYTFHPRFFRRLLFLLSPGIHFIINFDILSSCILLMWPYHWSLFLPMMSIISGLIYLLTNFSTQLVSAKLNNRFTCFASCCLYTNKRPVIFRPNKGGYGAETWTHRLDQKYLESFQMWCRVRKEISWTDRVRNYVLQESRTRGISYKP